MRPDAKKKGNETVLEGMLKAIGRQTKLYTRHIHREVCKRGTVRLVWNVPLQHEVNAFINEDLDKHFGPGGKCQFYFVDNMNKPLVIKISKVIHRF